MFSQVHQTETYDEARNVRQIPIAPDDLEALQQRVCLARTQHYRELRVIAFGEWDRAVE